MPVFFILAAGGALFFFNSLLRMLATVAAKGFAKPGWQTHAQQAAAYVKPVLDNVLGGIKEFKIDAQTLLLTAVVILLAGIWRSLSIANQHAAAAAKAAAATAEVKAKATERK